MLKGQLTDDGKKKAQDSLVNSFKVYKLENTDGKIYYKYNVS